MSLMTVLGQSRSFGAICRMSELPTIADVERKCREVRLAAILLQKSEVAGRPIFRKLGEIVRFRRRRVVVQCHWDINVPKPTLAPIVIK